MASFFFKLKQFTGVELIYNAVLVSAVQQKKSVISSVQSLSRVRRFVTPRTAARQASLSITNSRSWLKLMSIESMMPSNQLILCHHLPLLPSIFPSIRVFSSESVLHIYPLFFRMFPHRGHYRVMRKECYLTVITCLKVPSPNAHWGLGLQHMN